MPGLVNYLTDDHEHCDRLFADAENAVSESDWNTADSQFNAFKQATLLHLAREEEILFPAFEARTGMSGGPTYVMRSEHIQMRDTLDAMAAALEQRNAQSYLGLSETLLMLMRQHNMKEEQILYPMSEQALGPEGDALLERMRALGE